MLDNDLTGTKIGKLTVLGRGYNTPKALFWKCQCDCGKICYSTRQHLSDGTMMSCGCYRKQNKGKRHKNWDGIGELSKTFYTRWRETAKRRKIEFNVSLKYLADLFDKQDKKCAISGIEIMMPERSKDCSNGSKTASLDRIDSSKGYIIGNVQWLHKDVNMMKQQFNEDYFISLCNTITKNKGNK